MTYLTRSFIRGQSCFPFSCLVVGLLFKSNPIPFFSQIQVVHTKTALQTAPMSYIIPIGPPGYYNYDNQTTSSTAHQQHQEAVGGAAQGYYGTHHPPAPGPNPAAPAEAGGTTAALAKLVPPQVQMRLPRENPRLAGFYVDADRLLSQPTPMHESRYIASVADFNSWMTEVYHPKRAALQTLVSELESLQQRLHSFAEISAVIGPAGYHFLTPNLELGDVLDLLLSVERRAEEVHQDLLTMDDLKISLEATANATACYSHNDWDAARKWDEWKESSEMAAKRTFHSQRTVRKWDLASRLSNYYNTTEQVNTPPYEAIMLELSRIESSLDPSSSLNENDRAVLERALTILRVLKDQGCHACSLSWKARSQALQQDEVFARLETEPATTMNYELREQLLQRQREIIEENEGQAERANKAVTDHYVQYGEVPVMRLLGEVNRNSKSPTATATAGSGGVVAPPTQSARPSFQMPLSWYSNMLTSSHVTNMQVMNNIAGGSTNFHLANSYGQIKW
ncbi:hypothetical protein N657DRAFT_336213 [Parathielavia appendiculata]|uniref:Uncharacterized protein n=1 Tax=Parathielavia appendiculata TaxID=2587402 RepID=A0AAN6U1S8_9PEZI|nr:hypothetical protein N657DRAFT_336213 [Parathielavia appendiculata]